MASIDKPPDLLLDSRVLFSTSGIPEHEALWGHEMKGSAGTRRGKVLMAGGWQGQGAGKGEGLGAVACHHHHVFLRV